MAEYTKTIMLGGRGDTDQMLTELLAVAGPRFKARLLILQKQVISERERTDYVIDDLERRATQGEKLAAIRQMTIDAWRQIAQHHGAAVEDFEAPPRPTH
jgi:hypothetical protein